MIQTIQEQALLCADVLEKTVRGIRPRVGALTSPREGEPMQYVLVLADIIKANDADRTGKDAYRSARHKYAKGKLNKYKSACLWDLENPTNTLVSVFKLCAMLSDIPLH